jgi:hypothetical protein
MKAKFLWKRIPSYLKIENSELNRLWLLAQCLIQRKYAQAFEIVNRYKIANLNWQNQELANLVEFLIEKSKERYFQLVIVAYSSINIQELAINLGLTTDETIKVALSQGWTLDSTQSFLIPNNIGKCLN